MCMCVSVCVWPKCRKWLHIVWSPEELSSSETNWQSLKSINIHYTQLLEPFASFSGGDWLLPNGTNCSSATAAQSVNKQRQFIIARVRLWQAQAILFNKRRSTRIQFLLHSRPALSIFLWLMFILGEQFLSRLSRSIRAVHRRGCLCWNCYLLGFVLILPSHLWYCYFRMSKQTVSSTEPEEDGWIVAEEENKLFYLVRVNLTHSGQSPEICCK